MYTNHFGLRVLPFENVPDPKFFFDQGDHARIHNRIKDSLSAGRGLMVVTGPIGSGKTTLSQMIISEFSRETRLIWIAEPPANSIDLFLFIAQELGLHPSSSEKTFVLRDIRDSLSKINAEGRKCLVIIDESHLMSDDTINGIRLLNNLEEGSAKLIQILLLGQDELMEIIKRPEMEPFRQRIATLEMLGKMDPDRIRKYISHRIHIAGGQPSIFADTGWEAIVKAFGPGSTPRLINSLCDRSLNAAFEKGKTHVDVDDVYHAADGMGLQKEIFFYKIELNKKEKIKQVAPALDSEAEVKPAPPIKGPERPVSRQPMTVEPPSSDIKGFEQGFYLSARNQESLKTPTLVLAASVAVFILSVFFYCQRADSSDLMSCLLELIGL